MQVFIRDLARPPNGIGDCPVLHFCNIGICKLQPICHCSPGRPSCQVTPASNAIQQSTAFAFHALFSREIIRHRFVFIYFCTPSLSPISFCQNIISLPNKSHKSYFLLKYFWVLCGRTIKRTKLWWKEKLNIKIVEYWIWDNSGMIFCQQSKFNLKFPTSAESVFSQMWTLVAPIQVQNNKL